jgi:hypothetical protein
MQISAKVLFGYFGIPLFPFFKSLKERLPAIIITKRVDPGQDIFNEDPKQSAS